MKTLNRHLLYLGILACWGMAPALLAQTSTFTQTATKTPSNSPTPTLTRTPTKTFTNTATVSPTRTPTNSPTQTPTRTPTRTATNSPTITISRTPSNSPTVTPTRTPTNSATQTPTKTLTYTPTDSPTVNLTLTPPCAPIGIFGNNSFNTSGSASNTMRAGLYTLNAPATVYTLWVYCSPALGQAQAAIYTGAAGSVGTKVVESNVITVSNGWNGFTLPPTYLNSGSYWLAYMRSASSYTASFTSPGVGTNNLAITSSALAFGTFPTNMPTPAYSNGNEAIYAAFCLAPTNTPTITRTPTSTPTITVTFTPTITYTPTNTGTILTNTPTSTITSTPTNTATVTPTQTDSPTPDLSLTPGCGASAGTFGKTDLGSVSTSIPATVGMRATRFYLGAPATVVTMSLFAYESLVTSSPPTDNGDLVQVAIYQDYADTIGALVTQSAAKALDTGSSGNGAWNSFKVADAPLAPGYYWLAYKYSAPVNYFVSYDQKSSGGVNSNFANGMPWSTAFPANGSVFTSGYSQDFHDAIYANFCPAATYTVTPTATATGSATETPTPTNTPSDSPTPTPTRTSTGTLTLTNSPTITPTPTESSTATDSPTPTASGTATNSPTATPTGTPTNSPTITLTLTNSPTPTPSMTATNTPTFSPSDTPTQTATLSPTATSSNSPSNSPTPSSTSTATLTATTTLTSSPSNSPTLTTTPTATSTPTDTPTGTLSPALSPTPTASATASDSPTLTVTLTATNSPSATITPTFTNSPMVSNTPTPSATLTASATPSPTTTLAGTPSPTWTLTPGASAATTPFLYPNPVKDDNPATLRVDFDQPHDFVSIRVFTTAFRKVYDDRKQFVPAGVFSYSLDTSNFKGSRAANGLYYVVVTTPTHRWISKLLIFR